MPRNFQCAGGFQLPKLGEDDDDDAAIDDTESCDIDDLATPPNGRTKASAETTTKSKKNKLSLR